jgi:hypothetical protein
MLKCELHSLHIEQDSVTDLSSTALHFRIHKSGFLHDHLRGTTIVEIGGDYLSLFKY